MTPTISILVSTFNRCHLVQRALDSILSQTFTDFELFIIDDQSTDGTEAVIKRRYPDKRITYIYNEQNQAGEHGDKIHIRRFVHELARGKYWIYLDSDDFWLMPNLLARQVALFEAYNDVAMVTGAQQSYFVPEDRTEFTKGVLPQFLYSDVFLKYFANDPIGCNIIGGARLYNREMFIKSGALTSNDGRWESGFELTLAPACYGDHIYIDEPCIHTDIRPENASFGETQHQHFIDSVASVRAAFRKALIDFPERALAEIQRRTIQNIGKAYLANAECIKLGEKLGYCSEANTARYVTPEDVAAVEAGL